MATKDLTCNGKYIYITSEKGCSIVNSNGGGVIASLLGAIE